MRPAPSGRRPRSAGSDGRVMFRLMTIAEPMATGRAMTAASASQGSRLSQARAIVSSGTTIARRYGGTSSCTVACVGSATLPSLGGGIVMRCPRLSQLRERRHENAAVFSGSLQLQRAVVILPAVPAAGCPGYQVVCPKALRRCPRRRGRSSRTQECDVIASAAVARRTSEVATASRRPGGAAGTRRGSAAPLRSVWSSARCFSWPCVRATNTPLGQDQRADDQQTRWRR